MPHCKACQRVACQVTAQACRTHMDHSTQGSTAHIAGVQLSAESTGIDGPWCQGWAPRCYSRSSKHHRAPQSVEMCNPGHVASAVSPTPNCNTKAHQSPARCSHQDCRCHLHISHAACSVCMYVWQGLQHSRAFVCVCYTVACGMHMRMHMPSAGLGSPQLCRCKKQLQRCQCRCTIEGPPGPKTCARPWRHPTKAHRLCKARGAVT